MAKRIKSIKIEVVEHWIYKLDPHIHGRDSDNKVTTVVENIVTAEFTDGSISQALQVEKIMLEKRREGPEAE